jgi:hypothetical protein
MFEDQVELLLDPSAWPAGIRVCDWVFKPKPPTAPAPDGTVVNADRSGSAPATVLAVAGQPLDGNGASSLPSAAPGCSSAPHVNNPADDVAASMDCDATVVSDTPSIGFSDFSTLTASEFSTSVLKVVDAAADDVGQKSHDGE